MISATLVAISTLNDRQRVVRHNALISSCENLNPLGIIYVSLHSDHHGSNRDSHAGSRASRERHPVAICEI